MTIKHNDPEFLERVIGMPETHKDAFLKVAGSEKSVILVRATGPTCHGPLSEGYDTKGYRIHGKSCDWGPMAGFVMRDPRLNKSGTAKEQFNREKHQEALVDDHENQGWKASTTPLKISIHRIEWLIANKIITAHFRDGDRFDGVAVHEKSRIRFNYSLIRETPVLYGVFFDNSGLPGSGWIQEIGAEQARHSMIYGASFEAMLAMTNPPDHRKHRDNHYKNAITGDYDLFAIWPFVEGAAKYDASKYGLDHRPLGTVKGSIGKIEKDRVQYLEEHFTDGKDGHAVQGTKLGNITPRMYMICQLINSIVGTQVLWHSDEAARPFLDDMDLPVIAFTPVGNYFGIDNVEDFKTFVGFCEGSGIKVTLSNAWAQKPTAEKPNRLGEEYMRLVPKDGTRIVVPYWYNA
jgi:hypothetical protein